MTDRSNLHSLRSLGRRERQIMEIVHRLGHATAVEVLEQLPDPPTYSAVRGMLRYLESKGYLKHRREGVRNVYTTTASREQVRRSALNDLVRTFFGGSRIRVAAALLELPGREVSEAELRRLEHLVDRLRDGK
jgi:BlaI family transcriptional regulator, penicillinase repressor